MIINDFVPAKIVLWIKAHVNELSFHFSLAPRTNKWIYTYFNELISV